MAHAKAVNRKKNWDDDDPEGAASGVNTPITGNISFAFKILKSRHNSASHFIIYVHDYAKLNESLAL